jgi:hypothetical protein
MPFRKNKTSKKVGGWWGEGFFNYVKSKFTPETPQKIETKEESSNQEKKGGGRKTRSKTMKRRGRR